MKFNELKIDRKDHSLLRSLFNSLTDEQLPVGCPLASANTFKEKLNACFEAVRDNCSPFYFTTENAWDDNKFRMWSTRFDPNAGNYGVSDVQELTLDHLRSEEPPLAGSFWITADTFPSLKGDMRIKLDLRAQEHNLYMAARAKFWLGRVMIALWGWKVIDFSVGVRPPHDLNPESLVCGHLIVFDSWLNSSQTKARVKIVELWFDMESKKGGTSETQVQEIDEPDLEREAPEQEIEEDEWER